jgi:hypothetical protein
MKKFPIILLIILTGFLASGNSPVIQDKNKKCPSNYRDNIVIDGNAGEWPAASFRTNKDGYMVYSAANDTSAFYICVKIKDEQQQMRIMRSGMELWIDVKGKKKRETGIRFPLSHSLPSLDHRNMATDGRPDLKKIRLMFLVQMKEMETVGFREGLNGTQNNKVNKSGIIAVINWDSVNTMVYEARIPFRTLNVDINTLDHVSLGVIMKALPKPQGPNGGQQDTQNMMANPESSGGMGDQHRGGGMHQEGDHMGMDDRNRVYEDVDAWFEAGIAKK